MLKQWEFIPCRGGISFLIWAVMFIALAVPSTVHAGPFRLTGFDTASIADGNSHVASGGGLGVLYSNPALLSHIPPQIQMHFIVLRPNMTISLMDKPSNSDVPFSIYDSDVARGEETIDRALPTRELRRKRRNTYVEEWQSYFGLGFCHSFSLKGFRLGALFLVPGDYMATISTNYADEREQYFSNQVHFFRFGEWQKLVTGLAGVSYSPVKWISLGVSVQMRLAAAIDLDIYVPKATMQEYAVFNTDVDARTTFRPIAGIQIIPWEYIDLGLVFRWRSSIDVDDHGHLELWNYHETVTSDEVAKTELNHINQDYKISIDYEPMELSGGIGGHYAGFSGRFAVTWNRWVDYYDMHHEHPEEAAEYQLLDKEDRPPSGKRYEFKDTVSFNVGAQYRYLEWAEAKAGLAYYPSPIPPQTGRTNYADGDTLMASVGHRFDFEILEERFKVEIGLQFWQMLPRTTNKNPAAVRDEFPDSSTSLYTDEVMSEAQGLQSNNPGFPGYEQSGWVLVMSSSFHYYF